MQKVIKTVVTERLGIKYPIISGTMQWISRAELVAAVSNAGCLGILSSATFAEVEELRAEIRKVKVLTDKPFAVNMTFLPSLIVQDREAQLRCIAEEGVKIIETSGLIPADNLIKIIKDNNMTWIHKCTIVKHALKAQRSSCDMVVADGFECAGHPGENDIGSVVLTPAFVQALDVPVISAGGFGTGRQMAAAFMLGADAVYMGSRFCLSKECPILDQVKEYIAQNVTEMDTGLALRSFRNTSRYYNSNVVKEVIAKEKAGCTFEDVREAVSGVMAKKMFYENGDINNCGTICIGQVAGLLHEVMSCEEIAESLMKECVETLGRFDA